MPQVRVLADHQRNEVKVLLVQLLALSDKDFADRARQNLTKGERLFIACMEHIEVNGDFKAYRELLEIVTGKLIEENPENVLSEDEKALIARWRALPEHQGRLKAPDGQD